MRKKIQQIQYISEHLANQVGVTKLNKNIS